MRRAARCKFAQPDAGTYEQAAPPQGRRGAHDRAARCAKCWAVDAGFSIEITGLMPVVLHRAGGADCSGVIVAVVEAGTVELRCTECSAVVGAVQVGIMEALLGLECPDTRCARCGRVNTFTSLDEVLACVCGYCGADIDPPE